VSEPVITRALSERQLRDDGSDDTAFLNREGIPLLRDMRTAWNQRNGRDYSSYRHAGGSGLEAWYLAGYPLTGGLTLAAPSANVLRAYPFVAPARRATVDRLGFRVTTLAAGNGRVGLWENTADDNLYPSSLLADSGALSTATTGAKSATVSVPLVSGQLYWLSYLSDAAATLLAMSSFGFSTVLGQPSDLAVQDQVGISVAFTYAALPSTFPAGGAYLLSSDNNPSLAYRLSSP
jgi:hypothetical protein